MVVGFVNAGIMSLSHAVGVIIGANLGTTVTAWILSLSGISAQTPLLMLLKPQTLSPILSAVGVILILAAKQEGRRALGGVLFGFGILFAGMEMMSDAVAPLADSAAFVGMLTWFQNPLAGVLAGAVLTAVIQSSSASIGILQALSSTGAITVGMAVPIIMGQNIGTCVTALLSGVGADANAKCAAFVHMYFNVAGTVVLLAVFYILRAVGLVLPGASIDARGVALAHSAFNIAATVILLPLSRLLLRAAMLTVQRRYGVKISRGEEV